MRLLVDYPVTAPLKQDTLKKPGTITTSKCWVELDSDALTIFAKETEDGLEAETDAKHRFLLVAVEVTAMKSADFRVAAFREKGGLAVVDHSVVLRAKDHATAAEWVTAINEAAQAALVSSQRCSARWISHLNGCIAHGCTHEKVTCGFCRPHFRLYHGEDPDVERDRLDARPAASLSFLDIVVPRHAGRLGIELSDNDGSGIAIVNSVSANGLAAQAGVRPTDRIAGVNGFEVTGHNQLASVLESLPASTALHLAVVRATPAEGGTSTTAAAPPSRWSGRQRKSGRDRTSDRVSSRESNRASAGSKGGPTMSAADAKRAHADPESFVNEDDSGREEDEGDEFTRMFKAATPLVTTTIYGHGGTMRSFASLHEIATEVAAVLGEEETAQKVRTGLAATDELELSTLLVKLPLWGVPEDSRLAGFFKAMHFEVLFPALDEVETSLFPALAIRPQPSTWQVHARLLSSNECQIIHSMWSKATAVVLPAAPRLRLHWQLELRLNLHSNTWLGAKVTLLDYVIGDSEGADVQRQLTDLLAPLSTPTVRFRRVWRRPLHKLPVWKDLPRLIRGMVVVAENADGSTTTLYESPARAAIAPAIAGLLPVLATNADGPDAAKALTKPISKHLPAELADNSDVAHHLQSLLASCDQVTAWTRLLKCMHQEMLAPAIIEMHEQIGQAAPFKDLRGAWRLGVRFGAETVTVTHYKGEVAMSPNPEDYFRFDWVLVLTLDREVGNLLDSSVKITSRAFGPKTSYSTIDRVSKTLRPLMDATGGFPYAHVWSSLLLCGAAASSEEVDEVTADALDELRKSFTQGRTSSFKLVLPGAAPAGKEPEPLYRSLEMEEEDLPEPEPEPQELGWLKSDWSDVALRRQLDVLDRAAGSNVDYGDNSAESSIVELSDRAGPRPPPPPPNEEGGLAEPSAILELSMSVRKTPAQTAAELADQLWAAMKRNGVSFDDVRRLEVPAEESGKTAMAIWWIECVMGVRLRGKSLYEALSSGELLCDLINTVQPGLVPRITRASACTEMSAMRIAAKQRDNITRYLEACAGLGMRQYDLFMVVDLFEQKNLDAVSKNILSLSQLAAEEFSEWHGPVLSVRTNRVWFQPGALVSDWTNPVDPSSIVVSESESAPEGLATPTAAIEKRMLDVTGLDEEAAVRSWIAAVLDVPLDTATSLQTHLLNGVLLCKVVNAIRPGVIARGAIKTSERPWDHMGNIATYTKACEKLGVSPTFDTVDLFEGKNMRVVAQNLHALARVARYVEVYSGPLLPDIMERVQI